MSFYLEQPDSYLWPVPIKVPQSGGRFRSFTFDVEFRRVSQERREELGRQLLLQKARLGALQQQIEAAENDAPGKGKGRKPDEALLDDILTPRQIADELVVGWSGILDSEGPDAQPVPFSEATKAQLLNIGDVADAILAAWNDSIPGAKAKN
jgi:hypothetical protein